MSVVTRAGYSDSPIPAGVDRTIGTHVAVRTGGYSALFIRAPSTPGWIIAAALALVLLWP